MKYMKKIMRLLVIVGVIVVCANSVVFASVYDDFMYKKSDKLYKKSEIVKGKKQLTKYTNKSNDDATQYQIVKMSKGKITLRPQQGWWSSADPYFKKKILTYSLSSNCKFYYRDTSYPDLRNEPKYKKVSKKKVQNYMKDSKSQLEYVEEAGGSYYIFGYSGKVYVKNGKVVTILTDGGD